jgi:BirA family biotin operon repressor/biotin-[acetyl-CoA-carboxylase] ligase
MLIENSITSAGWNYSIIGVGLNVNQTEWLSAAPNPISIATITNQMEDLSQLLDRIIAQMVEDLCLLEDYEELKRQYVAFLYRKDGYHYYVEREVSLQPTDNQWDDMQGAFEAKIVDITAQGELVLQLRDEQIRTYHFKQIRYVINTKNEN